MTRLRADWLDRPDTLSVMAALGAAGHQAYFVGGCVRDTLLGRAVSDIDIATDARPDATAAAADAAGLKAVPTGVDHGTVTIIAGGRPFEVTTFRRDVATDGRHATVRFADRLEDDAARRDFTMNALYATPDGTVIDPVGGLRDLRAGRLRFIGVPADRIAEDYLRILRFFRFHAWFADPQGGVDAEALAACAAAADGLARLSPERTGQEMRRLAAAPDPSTACAAMAASGILGRVLPGAHPIALPQLVALEGALGTPPSALRRIAAMGGDAPAERLRLSRAEARLLALVREGVGTGAAAGELAYRHGADAARDIVLLRAALSGQPLPASAEDSIARGAAAVFPVTAADLMPALQGPALGAALRGLEDAWIASGFSLSHDALLSRLSAR